MAAKAQELLARLQQQKEEISAIQQLWASVFPEFEPLETRQCQVWLKQHDFNHIVDGLETTNVKLSMRQNSEVGPMDKEQVVQYASGVMKGLKRKAEGGAE